MLFISTVIKNSTSNIVLADMFYYHKNECYWYCFAVAPAVIVGITAGAAPAAYSGATA